MVYKNHNHDHHSCSKLALAGALAASIVYSLVAIFIEVLPESTLKLLSAMNHMLVLEQAPAKITLLSFVTGLVGTFVVSYIFIWLLVAIYHRLAH